MIIMVRFSVVIGLTVNSRGKVDGYARKKVFGYLHGYAKTPGRSGKIGSPRVTIPKDS
jgi:hypothetical protein